MQLQMFSLKNTAFFKDFSHFFNQARVFQNDSHLNPLKIVLAGFWLA
jgi:hypothetical protein